MAIESRDSARMERRKAWSRERIMDAALEVFAELGYIKTTVDNITTRADLGHGTFYQYFKNKQEILEKLADVVAENVDDFVRPKGKHLSVYEIIALAIKGILECYVTHRSVLLVLKEAMMVDKQFEEKWLKIHERLFRRIERELKGFIQKGLCRDNLDVDATIIALTSMFEGYAQHLMNQAPESVDIDAVSDSLADICYHAIFKCQC